MTKIRFIAVLFVMLLATVALASCGGNGTTTATTTESTAETIQVPSTDEFLYTADELAEANALLGEVSAELLAHPSAEAFMLFSSPSQYVNALERQCPTFAELVNHKCFLYVVNQRYEQLLPVEARNSLEFELQFLTCKYLLYVYDKESLVKY